MPRLKREPAADPMHGGGWFAFGFDDAPGSIVPVGGDPRISGDRSEL